MKRVIYFLLLSVAAFSCSDDDHISKAENNKVAHTEIITKKISWEEIQHEIVKSAIEELRGQLSQDISFARGGSDLLSGLSIVQDNIIYKEYYGRYSYTFATHREESNGFLENIIIEVGQNGEYSESLIQYEMSQEEIASLAAGEIVDLDDRLIIYTPLEGVNFSDILGRSAGCYTVEWSAPVGWCSNLGMSEEDAFNLGYSQSECGLVVVYTVTITDHCSESEGGDGGNGGLPGNGGNPYNPYDPWGGQGGGPNNGGPQGPITDPNPSGGGNSNTFGFTFTQWQWMNNNGAVKSQIIGYLSQGGDFSFATDLLDLLIELNYTTPIFTTADYPGKNEGFPFNWWKNDYWLDNNLSLDPYDEYKRLKAKEKELVKLFPTLAAFMAINRGIAEAETISRFGINGLNDKADAFRHAYFNALNTRSATLAVVGDGAKVVRRFGEAHETEVPSQLQLEVQMDLHNNEVGIQYCSDCYPGFTTDQTISNGIMQLLLNGQLRYLNPLNWILSPLYDSNQDGLQDCPNCLNGIISTTNLTPTNQ